MTLYRGIDFSASAADARTGALLARCDTFHSLDPSPEEP